MSAYTERAVWMLIVSGTLGWLGWLAKVAIRGATSVNLWRKRRARERAAA